MKCTAVTYRKCIVVRVPALGILSIVSKSDDFVKFVDILMDIVYITITGQKRPYEKRPAASSADHL